MEAEPMASEIEGEGEKESLRSESGSFSFFLSFAINDTL